jgi:hypothetical protein
MRWHTKCRSFGFLADMRLRNVLLVAHTLLELLMRRVECRTSLVRGNELRFIATRSNRMQMPATDLEEPAL